MNRIANRKLAAALAVIATFGCTPLTAFDALVPKDSGVMLAVDGAPTGPTLASESMSIVREAPR